MESPLEIGADRYQAAASYPYARNPKLRFDQRRLASLVGYVALGLPVILGLGGLALGRVRPSISAYHYEPFMLGELYTGAIVFIGALLLAYRGWHPKVARLASIAGICALLLALFPHRGWQELCRERVGALTGPQCAPPGWLEAASPLFHLVAAAVLFLTLAFFCLFVFTKLEPHQRANGSSVANPAKRRRNAIYRASGVAILGAMGAIGLAGVIDLRWTQECGLVFWMEAVAMTAFAVSWIVQGRASGSALLDARDRQDVLRASGHS